MPERTSTDEPEKLLPAYVIVFASGLSAIEALASDGSTVLESYDLSVAAPISTPMRTTVAISATIASMVGPP